MFESPGSTVQGLLQSRMCTSALFRAGSYIISLSVLCCLTYILSSVPFGATTSQQAAHGRLLLAATVDSVVPAAGNSSSSPYTTISSHNAQPVWAWDWRSGLALLLATINSVTAACTGQGGTQFLIPIFTGLLHMTTNSAVACTSFVIFLGSIPSLHHAMTAGHPARPGTPLVDYTFLSLVIPPILVGIKLGVVLNAMSPEWLISFLLIAAYGYSTWKQAAATLRMRRQEKQVALVTARIEALVSITNAPAAAGAAASGAVSALPGQLSSRQTSSQLQDDIQQLSMLSHDLLQMQAERLPPRLLACTTSSTIQAVISSLAASSSSLSKQSTISSSSSLPKQSTLSSSSSLSKQSTLSSSSSLSKQSTISSSSSLSKQSTTSQSSSLSKQNTSGSSACSTQGPHHGHITLLTPADQLSLAGSSSSKLRLSMDLSPVGSSCSNAQRSSCSHTSTGSGVLSDEQGAVNSSTWLGNDAQLSSECDQGTPAKHASAAGWLASSGRQMMQHLRLSPSRAGAGSADTAAAAAAAEAAAPIGGVFQRSVALAGVSAAPAQLLQLGRVLSRASTITERLNTVHSRSRVVRSDLVTQLTASADDTKDADAVFLQEPAAIATRSQIIAAATDVELGCSLSSSTADSQAAPTGRNPSRIAATLGCTNSRIKQRFRDVPRAAAAWWHMQPKQLLLLVAVSFALYICLTGSMAMLHKCSAGWVAVQLVFAAASVVLTVVSTWLQWRQAPVDTTTLLPQSAPGMLSVGDESAPAPAAAAAGVSQLLRQCSSEGVCSPFLMSMIMESPDSGMARISRAGESTGCHPGRTSAHAPHYQEAAAAAAAAGLAAPPAASCCLPTGSESKDIYDIPDDAVLDDSSCAAIEAAGAALLVASPYAEIEWTHRRLLYFPWLMFAAGVVSGLLGATPNTLFLSPYFMMAGCDPHVASATLKLALFLTAGSSTLGYLLQGQLIVSFGLAFGIANLLTTPLGQWAMDVIIGRTCQSSLIFLVGTARVIVALPLLVVVNGLPGALDLAHGHNVAFSLQRLCT